MSDTDREQLNKALVSRLNLISRCKRDVADILSLLSGGHIRGCSAATCDGPCSCRPYFKEMVSINFAEKKP